MPTIVYPSTIDYAWLYQRPQQLLKEIAALGYKVIYYNNEVYFRQKSSIIETSPNFLLCRSDIPLRYLKIEEPIISWISYPPHVSQIGNFNEKFVVFDALDNASDEFSSWSKHLDTISSKSDIILTTSQKLYNYHKKNHSNVNMCPNAADFKHFNKAHRLFATRPKDLPQNFKPIVGYFGALATWIDWDLMKYISKQNKNLNFVMIGPSFNGHQPPIKSNNVYFLGRKNYLDLPLYLQYFDVSIIPFKLSSMIEGCNPIKMYEYLSSGKPVIATNMPEVANVKEIYIGKTPKAFNLKLQQALSERFDLDKINSRIEYARNNSWTHRAKTAVKIIEKTIYH